MKCETVKKYCPISIYVNSISFSWLYFYFIFIFLVMIWLQSHGVMYKGFPCPVKYPDEKFEGGITNGALWYLVDGKTSCMSFSRAGLRAPKWSMPLPIPPFPFFLVNLILKCTNEKCPPPQKKKKTFLCPSLKCKSQNSPLKNSNFFRGGGGGGDLSNIFVCELGHEYMWYYFLDCQKALKNNMWVT